MYPYWRDLSILSNLISDHVKIYNAVTEGKFAGKLLFAECTVGKQLLTLREIS